MATNVTTAVFGEGCNTATASPSLVQWDKGQVLQISGLDLPDAYQVEFSTVYTRNAIPRVGDASGVEVPNELLQRSAPITAYIVLHGATDSRETEYWVTIHITPRTPPETTTPDPEQEDALDQAIAALEAGAEKAEAAAEAIQDMDVEAETLAEGSAASVEKTVDPDTGAVTLNFGIPKGEKGNPGKPGADGTTPNFRIGTVTTLPPESPAEATITGTKEAPALNLGIPQGKKGEPGQGGGAVKSVNGKTGAVVLNASDVGALPDNYQAPVRSVAGKTGAVTLGAGDVGYSESETYQSGTVGYEVSELSRQISDVEENQIPELKNAIDQKQDATNYVTLSGTIVTQTGVDNTMYLCGELAELTFTAPATGQTAIRFTSGTTPTVATFSGVTWLNGFDPSAIEASKTYEINILNGLGCAAWT